MPLLTCVPTPSWERYVEVFYCGERRPLNYICRPVLLLSSIWNSTPLLFVFLCFLFCVNIIKTFQQNRTFRGLPILCLYVFPLKTAAPEYIVSRWMQWIDLYCAVYFRSKAGLWYLSLVYIKQQWKYAARPPLIMWLCRGTKNSRRRSLCQEFCFSLPRGLQRCIFLLQQVPRLYQCYRFIATSYPATPTTRRHRWHWLRCAKNLLMCLNYLRLMLGAKRLQQCPGTALFLWWKFFEDHSFASYFVALPREMPLGSEAIRNTLINS